MNNINLTAALQKKAREQLRPDGTPYASLLFADEQKVAEEYSTPLREIEITALENDIIPERYCRNFYTLNTQAQIKLLQSHVAVIGQGGLGGTVTELLARLGLGKLTLVDGDVFDESNLNRQLLSTVEHLGCSKVEAGLERVGKINPAVEVKTVNHFLTAENGENILAGCDLAVDCLDSIPARFDLETACKTLRIPLVSAALAGTAGQATVIFPGDPGLRQIYGDPQKAGTKGIETRLGTLGYTAMFMAAIECAEAVTVLCSTASSLQNSVLLANLNDWLLECVRFDG